jgi:DnaJ-class molecular chaperone
MDKIIEKKVQSTKKEPCKKCNGTGKINNNKCSVCNGTGKVDLILG